MPPLTILTDVDVDTILHSLTRADILELQESLADALHWYSTSNDANDYCSDFQPERTVLKRKDGSTSLFMPASGMYGQGVKVVNVQPPDTNSTAAGLPQLADSLSIASSDSASVTSGSSVPSTPGTTASTGLSSASSTQSVPTLVGSGPPSGSAKVNTIKGSITLLDGAGHTTGLLNAAELTAFRTALASTMLLKKRQSVHDVTVFGGGKQAYWHIRLAMLLRPGEIHHLNIVTRSFDTATDCIRRLHNPMPNDPDYDNHCGLSYHPKLQKAILTPAHTEYERLLKEYVRASNVIFCTTPSSTPLFPASYLTNPEGRKKGRYIACIGSYKPQMIELHPDIVRYAVAPHHEHKHHHKRQKEGGAIIVDTVSGCFKEAGEVIQAKLTPDQVVELGELFMLKREANRKAAERGEKCEGGCQFQDDHGDAHSKKGGEDRDGLREWLTRGNVIFKSVGLGLMDIVVGGDLVRLARQRNIGTTIEGF